VFDNETFLAGDYRQSCIRDQLHGLGVPGDSEAGVLPYTALVLEELVSQRVRETAVPLPLQFLNQCDVRENEPWKFQGGRGRQQMPEPNPALRVRTG